MINYLKTVIEAKERSFKDKVMFSGLIILSYIYRLIVYVLRKVQLSRNHSLGKPTISVGNITAGGSGKTPFVGMLITYLQSKGLSSAVLTRGYKKSKGSSDEAQMLRQSYDVIVEENPNRIQGAKNVLEQHNPYCFILDDGFQQWAIHKDLDIVVINATNPFGNGRILPAGYLRESLYYLERADVIVINRSDLISSEQLNQIKDYIHSIRSHGLLLTAVQKPYAIYDLMRQENLSLDALQGQDVCLVSGIGDPASFEQTVQGLGANIHKSFAFEDHCAYEDGEWHMVEDYVQKHHLSWIITTDKDAVKLRSHLGRVMVNIVSVKITTEIIEGEKLFYAQLDRILQC